ncbi:MAG: MCP four helix bundle domain-containing protein, partial [SAR324 cluster bacterium]|nr:MCP four helix bundle domain-containing protein [SAR324 cluster bacterium]
MENVKIGTKLISSFLLVAAILVVVGVVGYRGLVDMTQKTEEILAAVPLADSSMKMQLAVRSDMQMIMELLEAGNLEEVDEVWDIHEQNITDFDTFVDKVLKDASDGKLKAVVTKADQFHNEQFQPPIAKIRELLLEKFLVEKQEEAVMEQMETSVDHVIDLAEKLEGTVKERIGREVAAGSSAGAILNKEITWADMAMEIKTIIAFSRIAIEEYSQATEEAELSSIKQEYAKSLEEFDEAINALLHGAMTNEGKIVAVDDPEIKAMVLAMDKAHDSEFQVHNKKFMELSQQIFALETNIHAMDTQADAIGEKMIAMLGEIEEISGTIMEEAFHASEKTASTAETA